MKGALGLKPQDALALLPGDREQEDLSGYLGDGELLAGRLRVTLDATGCLRLQGHGTYLLAPDSEWDLPVLTPRYRGSGSIELHGRAFKGDLSWGLKVIAVALGPWWSLVPESSLLPQATLKTTGNLRFDLEAHGEMGRAHFFLALRNLEDDIRESASYDDRNLYWVPLPVRHYEAGIEWHFQD